MMKRLLTGLICWLLGAQLALAAVALSNTDSGSSDTSNLTTITLTGKATGTAAADRLAVFCGILNALSTANTMSAVTIGGISATSTSTSYNPSSAGGGVTRMQCWWALVTTGTTANVVVTFSGLSDSTAEMSWAIYRVVGANTTTPLASAVVTATGAVPVGASLTIPASGAGIGMGMVTTGSASSWTNLTSDVTALGAILGLRYTFASSTSAGTSTVTLSSPSSGGAGAGIYLLALQQATGATVTPQRARRGYGN